MSSALVCPTVSHASFARLNACADTRQTFDDYGDPRTTQQEAAPLVVSHRGSPSACIFRTIDPTAVAGVGAKLSDSETNDGWSCCRFYRNLRRR
jgi:hypothetical protein